MKKIIIALLFLLCPLAQAQDVYSYGDTLKSVVNLDSGNFAIVDSVNYYIYRNPDHYMAGSYIVDGTYTLKSSASDSLFSANWAIPAAQDEAIYYLTSLMTYDGSVLKSQTSTFKIGPLSVVMSDTLGGMGYINEDSEDGSGAALGPIYLPGSVPADNANMLIFYHGTTTLAAMGTVDAQGNYKIWLDASGNYDMEVRYPGFQSGKKTNITPSTP